MDIVGAQIGGAVRYAAELSRYVDHALQAETVTDEREAWNASANT